MKDLRTLWVVSVIPTSSGIRGRGVGGFVLVTLFLILLSHVSYSASARHLEASSS
jgi:hypothetical protein